MYLNCEAIGWISRWVLPLTVESGACFCVRCDNRYFGIIFDGEVCFDTSYFGLLKYPCQQDRVIASIPKTFQCSRILPLCCCGPSSREHTHHHQFQSGLRVFGSLRHVRVAYLLLIFSFHVFLPFHWHLLQMIRWLAHHGRHASRVDLYVRVSCSILISCFIVLTHQQGSSFTGSDFVDTSSFYSGGPDVDSPPTRWASKF